jgi:hypothetical protein
MGGGGHSEPSVYSEGLSSVASQYQLVFPPALHSTRENLALVSYQAKLQVLLSQSETEHHSELLAL